MKTSGKYNNGQIVKELKGDTLTFYHKDGRIKAQGKYINDSFEGKWAFYKKEGYLWNIGHFKNNKKHGKWVRYKWSGTL